MNRLPLFSNFILAGAVVTGAALSGCRLNSVSTQINASIHNMNVNVNGGNVVVHGRMMNVGGNSSAAGQQVTAEFQQTVSAEGVQTLKVQSENGNVSVTAASNGANQIEIHATRQLQANRPVSQLQALLPQLKVTAAREGARLVLQSQHPRAWDNEEIGVVVNYEVKVPARLMVDAADVNGSVDVKGMKNGLDVTTKNGNVQLNDVAGAIHAQTTNGSIALANAAHCTDVRLRVVSGNVVTSDMQGSASNVEVVTKNGSVEFSGNAKNLTLQTTNGNIFAVLNASPQNAHLVSVSGSLDLHMPSNVSARLTADTRNGTVDVPHATINEARTSARATLGSGRAPVTMITTNGNISVKTP